MSDLREKIIAMRDRMQVYVDKPSTEGHIGPLFTSGILTQAKATIAEIDSILAEPAVIPASVLGTGSQQGAKCPKCNGTGTYVTDFCTMQYCDECGAGRV